MSIKKMKLLSHALLIASISLSSIAMAGPDEEAIKKTLSDYSRTESSFPRTLDIPSVVNIFTANSTRIENGESKTIDETKKSLMELEEMINIGNQIGVSSRYSNIHVQMLSPAYGLATYDYAYKAGMSGMVILEESGKCTSIMKKSGTEWLIHHAHCSTPKPKKEVEAAPPVQ